MVCCSPKYRKPKQNEWCLNPNDERISNAECQVPDEISASAGSFVISLEMIYGIHTEVILAAAYAIVLVGVATVLEYLARHSHNRSEHYRNSGFTYKRKLDVWECPTGHHLNRVQTDFERKTARYRAPAHKCNACHCKQNCTDSNDGRELESRLDAWVQSELHRFHRGISLVLFVLATVILAGEMIRCHDPGERILLGILLAPIAFTGSKLSVTFREREKNS